MRADTRNLINFPHSRATEFEGSPSLDIAVAGRVLYLVDETNILEFVSCSEPEPSTRALHPNPPPEPSTRALDPNSPPGLYTRTLGCDQPCTRTLGCSWVHRPPLLKAPLLLPLC